MSLLNEKPSLKRKNLILVFIHLKINVDSGKGKKAFLKMSCRERPSSAFKFCLDTNECDMKKVLCLNQAQKKKHKYLNLYSSQIKM